MKFRISVILIIILALALRLVYFKNITFFYDQARDALSAMEIFQGDPIKIIGPTSDFPGVHHGPLYWYIIAPIYFFSKGNVFLVKGFFVLLSLVNFFFVYKIAQSLFKDKFVSVLSLFLYAVSFEAIQYSHWLSNPATALFTITISFWSLLKLMENKEWAIIPLLISYGLSVQFQLFMLYQVVAFVIIWITVKGLVLPKVSLKNWGLGIAGFLISISTYVASEVKFNFQGTKSLFSFFQTQNLFGTSFSAIFTKYLDRLTNIFFLNVWGINLFLAGLATIFTIWFAVKLIKKEVFKKELVFLLLWIISPIIINFFSGPNSNYINLGTIPPAVILTAYLISLLRKKYLPLLIIGLAVIVLGNFYLTFSKGKEGDILFTVQKQMILSDEIKVIDWIYKEAGGKPYKLNTITSPLFINSLWAELFNWYGRSKYGYMPIWWGETQVDVPGSKIKFADESPTDLHFLIVEPSARSDDDYTIAIKALENTRSEVIKTQSIGSFVIEERKITTPRIFTSQDIFFFVKNTDVTELRKMGL